MKSNKKRLTTIAIHVFIWVALSLLPLLIKPKEITFNVSQLQGIYLNLGITVVLFYLCYSVIIPLFFYKKRIFITLALLVLVSVIGSFILSTTRNTLADKRMIKQNKELRINSNMPRKHLKKMRQRSPVFDNFFFFLLVAGAALSIRATQKWMDEEQDRKSLEVEKATIELAWLKNQVSPHFFFNTLNNIHSLIESRPQDAQKSVHLLSKLMRYLLYESNAKEIELGKEVAFIESYIGLMKLKLTKDVQVTFDYPVLPKNITLPPLLFNPLIENAFKFGISYQQNSFISMKLSISGNELIFMVKNSLNNSEAQKEQSGIGLSNLTQRLELLYKNRYSLDINKMDDAFEVTLKIPVDEN